MRQSHGPQVDSVFLNGKKLEFQINIDLKFSRKLGPETDGIEKSCEGYTFVQYIGMAKLCLMEKVER
jgi:hypothetical protein